MREILFRGKRLDNGEWVEGVAFSYDSESCIMFHLHPFTGLFGKNFAGYKVDADTVGQYTGLIDKDGKRIFEGDVVEYMDGKPVAAGSGYRYEPFMNRGAIEYSDGRFRWTGAWTADLLDTAKGGKAGCSVAGNIYDNPGLLGEKEGQ